MDTDKVIQDLNRRFAAPICSVLYACVTDGIFSITCSNLSICICSLFSGTLTPLVPFSI